MKFPSSVWRTVGKYHTSVLNAFRSSSITPKTSPTNLLDRRPSATTLRTGCFPFFNGIGGSRC